ncbi:Aste57867_15914 [Aphanomyces stellatus]|uniref:Aste57867_15914 protein n=1 Tax=Aphanomyces stellatus TaxID=120398 RepID=A0A485L5J2_9STRA|nr:hypothetical protein As57867_015858 [Aphanomyces stellatus]VFT92700.1 Aste57867_15914 [Aphanomyces stellatus]
MTSSHSFPTMRVLFLVGLALWGCFFLVQQASLSSFEQSFRHTEVHTVVPPRNETRGIIICVHDRLVPMTLSLVQEVRRLGNKDPIHMYHCENELSQLSRETILAVDWTVEFHDACVDLVATGKLRQDQVHHFHSYWLKPLALIHSQLDHVMLLDTDVMLFHNPDLLWDIQGYKDTGTLFFRDREIIIRQFLTDLVDVNGTERLALHVLFDTFDYDKFNLPRRPSQMLLESLAWKGDAAHEQDSSITLIHKSKAPLAMDVLFHLLTEEIHRHQPIFTHGDKELFWLAYELSQLPYFFSPWANSGSARPGDVEKHPETLCGDLVQWIPDARYQSVLLHINGAFIFNPFAPHLDELPDMEARRQKLLADLPTHVSKQRVRSKALVRAHDPDNLWPDICLYKRGSEPIREQDMEAMRRKINNSFDIAIEMERKTHEATQP